MLQLPVPGDASVRTESLAVSLPECGGCKVPHSGHGGQGKCHCGLHSWRERLLSSGTAVSKIWKVIGP